jgi:hypothetical protein
MVRQRQLGPLILALEQPPHDLAASETTSEQR